LSVALWLASLLPLPPVSAYTTYLERESCLKYCKFLEEINLGHNFVVFLSSRNLRPLRPQAEVGSYNKVRASINCRHANSRDFAPPTRFRNFLLFSFFVLFFFSRFIFSFCFLRFF
jgi:hypothetical protein